jgi:hypothetical protein
VKIFISYRRDDSGGHAGHLFALLTARFGVNNVFMDIDTIPPGKDFRKVITDEVGKCDVVLVLIGKQWSSIGDAQGRRRLDDQLDWVRVEIATALANPRIRVIPVLLQNARMPGEQDLPAELKELRWRNAIELSDSRFRHDTSKLIQAIEAAHAEKRGIPFVKRRQNTERRFPWLAAILVSVLGILCLAILYLPSIGQWLLPELTHTSIADTSTLEPTHTSATTISTDSQTAIVAITPEIQTSTPHPVENTTQPLVHPTSVSSAVPVEPTSIASTTTHTASPVAVPSIEISDYCQPLTPDALYPTPMAQQTAPPQEANYLLYESNSETLQPPSGERVKDRAEYFLYWPATQAFKDRLDSQGKSAMQFIVLDNREPAEGNYSICINAPPPEVTPVEYTHVAHTLLANESLRFTFFYRTRAEPVFSLTINTWNDQEQDSKTITKTMSNPTEWTEASINFDVPGLVVDNPEFCNRMLGAEKWAGHRIGCFNFVFIVEGNGAVWIDKVWVGKVP